MILDHLGLLVIGIGDHDVLVTRMHQASGGAIVDIDNGARFETYAIEGQPGEVCLNGAAARLVHPGDKVIVITYADYEQAEVVEYQPRVVHVDDLNRPVSEDVARELRGGPLAVATSGAPRPLRGSSIPT
ncbi:MAG: aspartate 1-decarboxylase [Actinomycetia bacterium]|nr:aspartate 1-decarboxylase [Actinomycetes bacterium]